MTGYARKCVQNTAMSFRANDKQLLKDYKKIWEKGWKVNEDKFWKQTYL